MKRYLLSAALVYFISFASVILWWNIYLDNIRIEQITLTTSIAGKNLASSTHNAAASLSAIRTIPYIINNKKLKHRLRWHWNCTSNDNFISTLPESKVFCNGNFIGYNKDFARLKNVVIDPSKSGGKRGGENISEVFNQKEEVEYYKLELGYFTIHCPENVNYTFNLKSHLNKWNAALNKSDKQLQYDIKLLGWAIAVVRYEYANLYHTVTDFYNTFLVAKAFNMEQGNITILWIDGHPTGNLDQTWAILFGRVLRAGDIDRPFLFSNLVWGIMGYHSPLCRHSRRHVPFLEEFRRFFLTAHGVSRTSILNCLRLNILIIWRRNYLAHPRKPSGLVTRKIQNEDELLDNVKQAFVGHNVIGVQLDKLDMKYQLDLISNTDILVGMHGAALSHILFLPKHSGVVELFPTYWPTSNIHFLTFAKWRNIHYLRWKNMDPKKDVGKQSTIVDIKAITDLILRMKQKLC